MSIPSRLGKIVKGKVNKILDRLESTDADAPKDAVPDEQVDVDRFAKQSRDNALQELKDSMNGDPPPRLSSDRLSDSNTTSASGPRSPQEIAATGRSPRQASTYPANSTGPDALVYQYKLLGVEPGSDFKDVHDAYMKFAARLDASRFPEGSAEAADADALRKRLEAAYKILRDALDPTSRRFDLLELDPKPTA